MVKIKKLIKGLLFLAVIFIVGGFGAVITDRYLFPMLSSKPAFSKYQFLKRATDNVTVINKTEQVIVQEDDSINKIAAKASRSVVNIVSVRDRTPFRNNVASNEPSSKTGSGVIVTSDGLLVTYRNVILEVNSDYKVFLFDGTVYDAELAGIDEFSNLAFLKIDKTDLPVITFANSDEAKPGRKIIAIGNSVGEYQIRYASGLLSNTNREFNISGQSLSSSEKLEGVFEVDLIDQDRYLGGPIIDYRGEIVGIIGSVTIDNNNKYFQIPSNVVVKSLEKAIAGTITERPYLGLYYVPITKSYAITNSLSRDRGAYVYSPSQSPGLVVISGSPAQLAGIRLNDIIISVDGEEINLDNPLSKHLSVYKKGDEINLMILRNGEEIPIPVQL